MAIVGQAVWYLASTASTWAPVAASAGGTYLAAKSQYDSGKSQRDLSNYNAQQLELDALTRQAEALAQATEQRHDDKRKKAAQRAYYSKANVEGASVLEVMVDTAENLEKNALEIERLGAKDAQNMKQRAGISRYEGAQAYKAGKYAAAGTILQGAAKIAGL